MKDIAFKRPRQTEACRTFSVENETKMKLPPTSNFVPPHPPKPLGYFGRPVMRSFA